MRQKKATRTDGREPGQLRPVSVMPGFLLKPPGSVLIRCGDTRVLCSADISDDLPPWMRSQKVPGGWITAEYQMLPGSNSPRSRRENKSGPSGRSQEIQRLIGRSLRAAVDLNALGSRLVTIDCDVLDADGGTRCASITGAMVAMEIAIDSLIRAGSLETNPIIHRIAAVSAGILDGSPVLDLCYDEDSRAQVDANFVMTEKGDLIEVQASAEGRVFSREQLDKMLKLARLGTKKLCSEQKKAIAEDNTSRDRIL